MKDKINKIYIGANVSKFKNVRIPAYPALHKMLSMKNDKAKNKGFVHSHVFNLGILFIIFIFYTFGFFILCYFTIILPSDKVVVSVMFIDDEKLS